MQSIIELSEKVSSENAWYVIVTDPKTDEVRFEVPNQSEEKSAE